MNELPLSIFEILTILNFILIAYSFYNIDFNKPIKIDKIITAIISSPLSFILSNSIINGTITETYVDTTGLHYVPIQSLPFHYFLMGFAVLMTILSVLLIIKFISDHFETLQKKSALGDWEDNGFRRNR